MERLRGTQRSVSEARRQEGGNSRPSSREPRERRGHATPMGSSSPSFGHVTGDEEEVASTRLHVVCRLRPMSDHEKRSGTVPCVTASTERSEVVVARLQPGSTARQVKSTFHFDHVLTSFSTQNDVYVSTLKPLIREVLNGFEAAVFAYGQTGTGKTYTMEGDLNAENGMGLVPRASAAVIQAVALGNYASSCITASCLEIYNEELTDLLAQPGQQPKLDLKETGHGVACVGISEVVVSSFEDVQALICSAQERRRIAETRVNARSSRSHCLFTLRVCIRRRVPGGEVENTGKLHLVDLAGSECAKKACMNELARLGSGSSSADAERERRNINQSLLTLGRVIAALRDGGSRIPYRDSKLTRLLQEALGGCCRTVMIATISPAQAAVDETVSTLAYAEQAMGIQNRPIAASRTISDVSPVGGVADGGEVEMKLAYLTQEVEEAQTALVRKQREAEELNKQVLEAEAKYASVVAELEELQDRTSTMAASVRQQACDLHFAAGDRVRALLASPSGIASATSLGNTIDAVNAAWCDQLRVSKESFDAQQRLLEDIVRKVQTSSDQLSEVVAGAIDKAASAAAAEADEDYRRLDIIDEAICVATSRIVEGSNAAQEAARQGEATLSAKAGHLRDHALSSTHGIADVARHKILAELDAIRQAAISVQRSMENHMVDTATRVQVALSNGNEHLHTTWADLTCGFASVQSSLCSNCGKDGEVGEGNQAPVGLDETLLDVASSLTATREDVAREVDELRRQRETEEQLMAKLAHQREELRADMARLEDALAGVSSELEAARNDLKIVEEEQACHREQTVQALLAGVEALVRDEMGAMGRQLEKRNDMARGHLDEAEVRLSTSSTQTRAAEEGAVATGQKMDQIVAAMTSTSESVCDGLDATQAKLFEASQRLHTEATETLGGLAAEVGRLQAVQDAVQPRWNEAKNSIAAAVSAWHLDQGESEAACMSEESQAQVENLRKAAETQVADLEEAKASVAELVEQMEAVGHEWANGATAAGDVAAELFHAVGKSAKEVAKEAGDALKQASRSLESQRMAVRVGDAAAEDRRLELEQDHEKALQPVRAAAALAQTEKSNTRADNSSRHAEERVEAAHRRVRAELQDHQVRLEEALMAEQQFWRLGLSKEPILAFSEENTVEAVADKICAKSGGKAHGAPRSALRELQVSSSASVQP